MPFSQSNKLISEGEVGKKLSPTTPTSGLTGFSVRMVCISLCCTLALFLNSRLICVGQKLNLDVEGN